MARDNNVIVDHVWADLANTVIPPNPTPGLYYRNDALTSGEIENGQGFGNILDSATYNQLLFLLTSAAKTLCENGIMPYQTGQAYISGALCLYTDGNVYSATRAILSTESPYPYPGDGTGAWEASPATMTGATAILPGAKGLVPAPAAGDQDKALFGDGSWKTVAVANMTGATNSLPGTAGLVPAPPAGSVNLPLCGDGTFKSAIGASAAKLTTARTIALSGNATGSASFDGSSNVTINTAVNYASNANTANTATKANQLTTARTIALSGNASGSVAFNGTSNVTINTTVNYAAQAGQATKANQLTTARTIALSGKAAGSTSFNGTANATINVTQVYPTIQAAVIGTVNNGLTPAVLAPAGGIWWCHGEFVEYFNDGQTSPVIHRVNGSYSGGATIYSANGVHFSQTIMCIKTS